MTDQLAPAAEGRPETGAEGPPGTRAPGGARGGSGDNATLSPEPPHRERRALPPRPPFDPATEAPELSGMVGRVLRSMVRRAEAGDIDALEQLVVIRQAADLAIADAAYGLVRGPGQYSWGEVGRWLGMTRQAARQRWARRGGGRQP